MKFGLVGVTGEHMDLSAEGGEIMMGPDPKIFGPPPVQLTSPPTTGRSAGEPSARVRHLARPLSFDLTFFSESNAGLRALFERYNRLTDATRGNARLIVDAEDGSLPRELYFTVTGGAPRVKDCESTTARAKVIGRASDPFWHGTSVEPEQVTFDLRSLPELSTSGLQLERHVVNKGSAPAWPTWKVDPSFRGPLTIMNESTGRSFRWTRPSSGGSPVVIETREGTREIYDTGSGESHRRGLDVTLRDLFPFEPGVNRIRIEMFNVNWTGSIPAAPYGVHLSWSLRFLEC